MEYDCTPEGWLSAIVKADGAVLTFEYDKTGNLITQNVGEGQSIASEYNEIGMMTKVTSPEGTICYQYDEQRYLVSIENANGDVVSYTHNAFGHKDGMTHPDGRTVIHEYYAMHRMTTVVGLGGEKTTYTYDAVGGRIETRIRNGEAVGTLTTTYEYDSVGNLLKQVASVETDISFAYTYNKNNYIINETRTEAGRTTTSSYAYDPLAMFMQK